MCEPATIVAGVTAISGVTKSILDFSAQNDAAAKNKEAALQNEQLANQQLTLRQMQEQAAARQNIYQSDLAARKAEGSALVMAGESGVAGSSVDAVTGDINMQRSRNDQNISTNLANSIDQINQQRLQIHAQAQNQINSMPAPNPWATALQIGGVGLNTLDAYQRNMPSKGNTTPGGGR